MPDETNASQEASLDEQLSRAAEEARTTEEVEPEEVKEEIQATEEVQETVVEAKEDEDNRERSRLGRKVKQQEERIAALQDSIERLLKKMEETRDEPENKLDPDALITVGEMEKILSIKKEKEKAEADKIKSEKIKYEAEYSSAFLDLNEGADASGIEAEMLDNFNEIITGNPAKDAKLNYERARGSYYAKKAGQKTVKLKGDNPQGVNTTGHVVKPSKKEVKLSPDALKFLKREGLDMDWAQKHLGS